VAEVRLRLAAQAEGWAEHLHVRHNAAQAMATPAALCGSIEAHPLPTTRNT
jgi:hypothetical protein